MEIQPINPSTFKIVYDKWSEVEIGDLDSTDFEPTAKLKKWNDECFIKVSLPTTKKKIPLQEDRKIKWKDTDKEIHFYPLEKRIYIEKDSKGRDHKVTQNDNGGFEIETVLKKKPKSNILTFDIGTKGLKFFYQPELTQEEEDRGAFRPKNVIGSYAVYHATKTPFHKSKEEADKYKVGKAFHIYRPKARDSNGNEVWGELEIKDSKLTITIPQEFLDNAVYPVRVTGTDFGNNHKGDTEESVAALPLHGGMFNSGGEGTLESMNAYVRQINESGTYHFQCAIYEDGDNGVKVDVTNEATIVDTTYDDWYELSFPATPETITDQNYWLYYWFDNNTAFQIRYDADGDSRSANKAGSYNSWADDLDDNDFHINETEKYSIYCTYSEEVAGLSIPVAIHHYQQAGGL